MRSCVIEGVASPSPDPTLLHSLRGLCRLASATPWHLVLVLGHLSQETPTFTQCRAVPHKMALDGHVMPALAVTLFDSFSDLAFFGDLTGLD